MNLETLRAFFGWCTILNGGLLIFASLFLMFAGDLTYKLHDRWFQMSRETFTVATYAFLGWWKIAVISLHLVPWTALALMS